VSKQPNLVFAYLFCDDSNFAYLYSNTCAFHDVDFLLTLWRPAAFGDFRKKTP